MEAVYLSRKPTAKSVLEFGRSVHDDTNLLWSYCILKFWGIFLPFLFYFQLHFQFLLIFYSFLCILFSNGHKLCNVFLLSHWLLCKEKNKVNYIIILLFLPHFHKEARNQLTGRSNWLKDSIGHLVFRDLTFCHCCHCP